MRSPMGAMTVNTRTKAVPVIVTVMNEDARNHAGSKNTAAAELYGKHDYENEFHVWIGPMLSRSDRSCVQFTPRGDF